MATPHQGAEPEELLAGCAIATAWAIFLAAIVMPISAAGIGGALLGFMLLREPRSDDFVTLGGTAVAMFGFSALAYTAASQARRRAGRHASRAGAVITLGAVLFVASIVGRYGVFRATAGAPMRDLGGWWLLAAFPIIFAYEWGAFIFLIGLVWLLGALWHSFVESFQPRNDDPARDGDGQGGDAISGPHDGE